MFKVMKRQSFAAMGLSLTVCFIVAGSLYELLYGPDKPILKAMDAKWTH
jgi:hypothetical protein